jgi:hypothetical protein
LSTLSSPSFLLSFLSVHCNFSMNPHYWDLAASSANIRGHRTSKKPPASHRRAIRSCPADFLLTEFPDARSHTSSQTLNCLTNIPGSASQNHRKLSQKTTSHSDLEHRSPAAWIVAAFGSCNCRIYTVGNRVWQLQLQRSLLIGLKSRSGMACAKD